MNTSKSTLSDVHLLILLKINIQDYVLVKVLIMLSKKLKSHLYSMCIQLVLNSKDGW